MSKICTKCEKAVYPLEEIKCLDKVWHKLCFRCAECGMLLNMKNYKGYNKIPYCVAHYPKAKATIVAETPESARLAQNTKQQSLVKYHEEFEKKIKGSKIEVVDDHEIQRVKKVNALVSQLEYKGKRTSGAPLPADKPKIAPRPIPDQVSSSNGDKFSPFTSRTVTNSTVYTSDGSKAVRSSVIGGRIGSIADYDPMNENYGSLAKGYKPASRQNSIAQADDDNDITGGVGDDDDDDGFEGNAGNDGNELILVEKKEMRIEEVRHEVDIMNDTKKADDKQQQQVHSPPQQQQVHSPPQQQHVHSPPPQQQVHSPPQQQQVHSPPQQQQVHLPQQSFTEDVTPGNGDEEDADTAVIPEEVFKVADAMCDIVLESVDKDIKEQLKVIAQPQKEEEEDGDVVAKQHDDDDDDDDASIKHQHDHSNSSIIEEVIRVDDGEGGEIITTPLPGEYIALYDYEAQDVDEVSFSEDDVIIEVEKIDDGWLLGTVSKTTKRGMLPANYVQFHRD